MSRIAFLQDSFMEYMGIMYLSSALKARGHEVEIFISSNIKKQINTLKKYKPHIVGFSCMTGLHNYALRTAKAIKSSMDTLIILGGPHPTFFPEIIEEPGVDIICLGEGESAVVELATGIDLKKEIENIPNLWLKHGNRIVRNSVGPITENLDSLFFPDREVYYSKYPFMDNSKKCFIAGRGCPYQCSYCFNSPLQKLYRGKGKYVRLRSVENVISEIKKICERYKTEVVYMLDDTFITDRPWVFEFLEKYKLEIGLPFICLIRADLTDEEMVRRLKSANCYTVFWGIESGNEDLRNLILSKNITNPQIIETATLLRKYEIKFRTYNMLGIPGESLDQAFETVDLNIKIKTDYPWCSLLQPYPKTPIAAYARERGMIKYEVFSRDFFRSSILDLPQIKEISNLQKLFYWVVKFPFLRPLIKNCIKLPSNIIFDLLFLVGYAHLYYRSEHLRFWEGLRLAWQNIILLIRANKMSPKAGSRL